MSIIEYRRISHVKLCWKYLKRLSIGNKTWMLFIMLMVMLIRLPEASSVNVTVKSTSTVLTTSIRATVMMPMANIVSLMKGTKPISIPENEVITSADTEDYLEEDSEEDYDSLVRKENASGEFFNYPAIIRCQFTYSLQECLSAVAVSLHATNDYITCSAIQIQIVASVPKTFKLR